MPRLIRNPKRVGLSTKITPTKISPIPRKKLVVPKPVNTRKIF